MLSINPAPTDTAVPLSNPTPSRCQQTPVLHAAVLHHQPMKSSDATRFFSSFHFLLIQRATSSLLETTEDEKKVGVHGWKHVVPVLSSPLGALAQSCTPKASVSHAAFSSHSFHVLQAQHLFS